MRLHLLRMEARGRDCEESGEEGPVAVVQREAGMPSKLLLRQESQAAEGNAQQGPPSQGWGWMLPNMQGPQAPSATPLMLTGLLCPWSWLEMGLAPKRLCL